MFPMHLLTEYLKVKSIIVICHYGQRKLQEKEIMRKTSPQTLETIDIEGAAQSITVWFAHDLLCPQGGYNSLFTITD